MRSTALHSRSYCFSRLHTTELIHISCGHMNELTVCSFERFPGIWHHGDFVQITSNGGRKHTHRPCPTPMKRP